MAAPAPIFPGRIPSSAPIPLPGQGLRAVPPPNVVPFRGAPSAPVPPLRVAPPALSPGLIPRNVPFNSVPPPPPNPGVAAVPAAVAAAEAGAGAALVPALAGAAGAFLLDLLFPQPAAAPEAPGIDPSLNPLYQPEPARLPVTLPGGGIQNNGIYLLTCNYLRYTPPSAASGLAQQTQTEVGGSDLSARITQFNGIYNRTTTTDRFVITGMAVTLLTPGTGTPTFPDYSPLLNPIGGLQPLQNPVPVDSQGNRRAFVPPPQPVIVPFTRPAAPPTAPPSAPPGTVPLIPPPPVIPEIPPEVPPFVPPVPYNPISPVPGFPNVPSRRPVIPTNPVPPFQPMIPPSRDKVPPLKTPPNKVPPEIPPPVDEKGSYTPPAEELKIPPSVPPTQRTRGADCCDPPDSEKPEDCCDEILEELKKLRACACPEDRELATEDLGVGDSITAGLPVDTIRVSVQVEEPGVRVRTQSGNQQGQTVYFLGWYSFGRDGKWDDRKPISHLYSEFICPARANMFTFSLVFETEGAATATYLLPVDS